MNKKMHWAWGLLILIAGIAIGLIASNIFNAKENKEIAGVNSMVYIGDIPITDFIIVNHDVFSASDAVTELNDYIEGKTGSALKVKIKGGDVAHTIRIVCDKNAESGKIVISGGRVVLYGVDAKDCVNTVRVFANTYLGWAFAGTDRAFLLDTSDEIHIPLEVYAEDIPWINEREPIICLWKTNVPRGQFYNTGASLKSEILSYSDDQIYEYVKLMKSCGFTGIQVTDMCSAWAQYSGYEYVHERLRFMADAAHSLGMKFTLWVWGAEFEGYGWVDDSVVYIEDDCTYAYESEKAKATFDKYYSIYAELADVSDRVIAHFDDPSNIHNSEDVAYFAKMLRDKFCEVNPDINFGISDYTNMYDKSVFAEVLGSDITVYGGAVTAKDSNWRSFREDVKNAGCDLGIWSWNLCEMEIDQLAEMNVNANLIKSVYNNTAVNGDDIMVPSYWSEMDSYHLANIFSLYCAGHLLQNPTTSSEELLHEVAKALVGDEYADTMYEILNLIQTARTGDSWESFKWGYDEYILMSDDYPAGEIYEKCNLYCGLIDEMIEADIKSSTLPLPVSVSDVLSIVRTHLKQIHRFSEFRLGLLNAESMYNSLKPGDSLTSVIEYLDVIAEPVPNYDAVVGVWGQPEALSQYRLLMEFCDETGIEFPKNLVYRYYLKQYIYQEICALQKLSDECFNYNYGDSTWKRVLGEKALEDIINALIDDGIIKRSGDKYVYLPNWEDYVFAYN